MCSPSSSSVLALLLLLSVVQGNFLPFFCITDIKLGAKAHPAFTHPSAKHKSDGGESGRTRTASRCERRRGGVPGEAGADGNGSAHSWLALLLCHCLLLLLLLLPVYLVIEGTNESADVSSVGAAKKIQLALEAVNKEARDNWVLGMVQTAKLYGQRITVHK